MAGYPTDQQGDLSSNTRTTSTSITAPSFQFSPRQRACLPLPSSCLLTVSQSSAQASAHDAGGACVMSVQEDTSRSGAATRAPGRHRRTAGAGWRLPEPRSWRPPHRRWQRPPCRCCAEVLRSFRWAPEGSPSASRARTAGAAAVAVPRTRPRLQLSESDLARDGARHPKARCRCPVKGSCAVRPDAEAAAGSELSSLARLSAQICLPDQRVHHQHH